MLTRIFFAGMLAFAITAANAETPDEVAEHVALFKKVSSLDAKKVDECATKLQMLLQDGDIVAANKVLRAEGCLNKFDGFTTIDHIKGISVKVVQSELVIRFDGFVSESGDLLAQKLKAIDAAVLRKVGTVYVDLVGNGGGSVLGTRDVLRYFAPSAKTPFIEIDGKCPDLDGYQAKHTRGMLAGKRYVIFVNGKTMSAAEMFTAQLLYLWYPATTTVIGVGSDKTYGKTIMQYGTSGDLRVTCGRWVVPQREVQGVGIPVDRQIPVPKGHCDADCVLASIKHPELVGAR